tara:strand:+ start:11011 stop:11166 length:156 start_codon:yes stop_codon:yes gene_type:complete
LNAVAASEMIAVPLASCLKGLLEPLKYGQDFPILALPPMLYWISWGNINYP